MFNMSIYVAERARKNHVKESIEYTHKFLEDVVGKNILNIVGTYEVPEKLIKKYSKIVNINDEEFLRPKEGIFHRHNFKVNIEKGSIPLMGIFYGRRLIIRKEDRVEDWELVKSRKLDDTYVEMYGVFHTLYSIATTFHNNSHYIFPHEIGHMLLNLKDHGGTECLMHPPAREEKFPQPKLCKDCMKSIKIKKYNLHVTDDIKKAFSRLPEEIIEELEEIKKIDIIS